MKWLLPSLVLVLLIFQQPLCTCSSISDLFETWCQQNGKKYSSEQERMYRFKVFEENYAYITEHNSKGNSSYTLGLNAYSDLTHHEFRNSFLGLSSSANDFIRLKGRGSGSSAAGVLSDVDAPSSLDWRDKGAVTNVKNQGSCGMLSLLLYLSGKISFFNQSLDFDDLTHQKMEFVVLLLVSFLLSLS